ncbi:hypothetical protein AVEN_226225-1 [Araneus ventricosus]|uniref:Uncharacterized protein n=1 Tax=Araneus ventricosus TaxID=182803 RepID=A0A4Y2J7H8_ARAVE|nr:hypothetical protein AVEN_226225-1 [Araneus ventricosus]
MENFCGVSFCTAGQHVDGRLSRVTGDNSNFKKFEDWLICHDPFPVGSKKGIEKKPDPDDGVVVTLFDWPKSFENDSSLALGTWTGMPCNMEKGFFPSIDVIALIPENWLIPGFMKMRTRSIIGVKA